jgi:hypothetical protein
MTAESVISWIITAIGVVLIIRSFSEYMFRTNLRAIQALGLGGEALIGLIFVIASAYLRHW